MCSIGDHLRGYAASHGPPADNQHIRIGFDPVDHFTPGFFQQGRPVWPSLSSPAAAKRKLRYSPNGSSMFDPAPGAYIKVNRASVSGDVLIAETVLPPTEISNFSSNIRRFLNSLAAISVEDLVGIVNQQFIRLINWHWIAASPTNWQGVLF